VITPARRAALGYGRPHRCARDHDNGDNGTVHRDCLNGPRGPPPAGIIREMSGYHYEPAPSLPKIRPTWIALLVMGAIVVAVGVTLAARAGTSGLDRPILSSPGSVTSQAGPGTYLVYAQSGSSTGGLGFNVTDSYPAQVELDTLSVTERGVTLPVQPYDSDVSQTLTRGSRIFAAVGQVRVTRRGPVTLTATQSEGALILAPSIGGIFRSVLPGALTALAGLLIVVPAVAWRVVAGNRRRPRFVQDLAAPWPPGPFAAAPGLRPPPPSWLPPPGASRPAGPQPGPGESLPPR
jgi:hypothetical protein